MMGKRVTVFFLACVVSVAHVFGSYLVNKKRPHSGVCSITVKGIKFAKRRREILQLKKNNFSGEILSLDIAETKKIKLRLIKPALNTILIFWKTFLAEPVRRQFDFLSSVQIVHLTRPPDLNVQYCKFLI